MKTKTFNFANKIKKQFNYIKSKYKTELRALANLLKKVVERRKFYKNSSQ